MDARLHFLYVILWYPHLVCVVRLDGINVPSLYWKAIPALEFAMATRLRQFTAPLRPRQDAED